MAKMQSIDEMLSADNYSLQALSSPKQEVVNTSQHEEVIHKERSKERQKDNSQLPIGQLAIGQKDRTVGSRVARDVKHPLTEVESPPNKQQEQAIDQSESALGKAERRSRAIKTLEVDDYLIQLVCEGLLDEGFIPYFAKVCYTIGLQKVNMLVNNVRGDDKARDKKKLLAWKMNGALQLHHKKAYYQSIRSNGEQ